MFTVILSKFFHNLKNTNAVWHWGEDWTYNRIHTQCACCTGQRKYVSKVIKLQAHCYGVCYDNNKCLGCLLGAYQIIGIPLTYQSTKNYLCSFYNVTQVTVYWIINNSKSEKIRKKTSWKEEENWQEKKKKFCW